MTHRQKLNILLLNHFEVENSLIRYGVFSKLKTDFKVNLLLCTLDFKVKSISIQNKDLILAFPIWLWSLNKYIKFSIGAESRHLVLTFLTSTKN